MFEQPNFNVSGAEDNTTEPRPLFIEMAKAYHSDKGGDVEKMKKLNEAYELAKDGDNTSLQTMYREFKGQPNERQGEVGEKRLSYEEILERNRKESKEREDVAKTNVENYRKNFGQNIEDYNKRFEENKRLAEESRKQALDAMKQRDVGRN